MVWPCVKHSASQSTQMKKFRVWLWLWPCTVSITYSSPTSGSLHVFRAFWIDEMRVFGAPLESGGPHRLVSFAPIGEVAALFSVE